MEQIRGIRQARDDVKGAVRFFNSIRHAPLVELSFGIGSDSLIEGPPVEGISSLEKLRIEWYADDDPNVPGNSADHLYHLIRPSLQTLVELKVENYPETGGVDLDIRLLSDAGKTLRVFDWTMLNHDEAIQVDAIPEIFPRLTKLVLEWRRNEDEHSLRWKMMSLKYQLQDSHLLSLEKNTNLDELQLSSDLEEDIEDTVRGDNDYAWYVRCYKRRLETTRKISDAMPRLRKCRWLQLGTGSYGRYMIHRFVIEERLPSPGEHQVVHVLRGIRQRWMGDDKPDRYEGGIVKCKLEDLPGDIIDEFDPEDR
ncbi:hypothetical protein H0H92_010710, partial [Tricholoma furcatifolium]